MNRAKDERIPATKAEDLLTALLGCQKLSGEIRAEL
jgi:hypothetical protein